MNIIHDHDHGHDDHHHEEDSHAVVPHDDHPVAHHDDDDDIIDVKAWWETYRNSALMQAPLVVLAFFAITAGWVGINPDFPILEWLTASNNFFHDFVGDTLLHHPTGLPFNLIPVIASLAAFGVGAFAAYVVYGTPREAGAKDPVEEMVGEGTWAFTSKSPSD